MALFISPFYQIARKRKVAKCRFASKRVLAPETFRHRYTNTFPTDSTDNCATVATRRTTGETHHCSTPSYIRSTSQDSLVSVDENQRRTVEYRIAGEREDYTMTSQDDEAMARADKEMEERANRAKQLLSQRYRGLRNDQVRIKNAANDHSRHNS